MTSEVDTQGASGLSRRDLMKRGAIVGAAAAWTIPVLQVVSMTPAHAESASAPRNPPGGGGSTPVVPTDPGKPVTNTGTPVPNTANVLADTSTALPNTGTTFPVVPTAAIGAAAIALGGGIIAATRMGGEREKDAPLSE